MRRICDRAADSVSALSSRDREILDKTLFSFSLHASRHWRPEILAFFSICTGCPSVVVNCTGWGRREADDSS
jgi:hypothetical protein